MLGLFLLGGCKDSSQTKVVKQLPAPVITEADKASAIAFGEELEARLLHADTDFFIEVMDLGTMVFSSFEGEKIPDSFRRGVESGLKGANEAMAANVSRSQFDFVGYEEVREYPGLLFRVRTGGGFDYVRYQLKKSSSHSMGWKVQGHPARERSLFL